MFILDKLLQILYRFFLSTLNLYYYKRAEALISQQVRFQWDEGNKGKILQRHGIKPKVAESAFSSDKVAIQWDREHSLTGIRYILLGKIKKGAILYIIFTLRGRRVRIISARFANRSERKKYERR